jgi:hypothetical protein
MTRTLVRILLLEFLVLAYAVVLMSQQPQVPPGSKIEPTEVETLQLQLAQKDAIIAQQQSQSLHQQAALADQQSQDKLSALQKLAEEIKRKHGWGDDVTFDPNRPGFTKADKPAPKKP